MSVNRANLILCLFGWLFYLDGAFANGLTDYDENILETVVWGRL